jgi:hypothetical protein
MPFIEMGRETAALAAAALKEEGYHIPREWLEKIRKAALAYARKNSQVARVFEEEGSAPSSSH